MSVYESTLQARDEATDATEARMPTNASSTVLSKALPVGSGGVRLFGFHAYSTKGVGQWIMVFDATTQPANGSVTPLVWAIAANSYVDVLYVPGRFFDQGIWICNSTTDTSLTLGAADCLFDVQYGATY